jgi:hypothetical protein
LVFAAVQFTDLHLEMRSGKLGLDFTQFDNTISSTGEEDGNLRSSSTCLLD